MLIHIYQKKVIQHPNSAIQHSMYIIAAVPFTCSSIFINRKRWVVKCMLWPVRYRLIIRINRQRWIIRGMLEIYLSPGFPPLTRTSRHGGLAAECGCSSRVLIFGCGSSSSSSIRHGILMRSSDSANSNVTCTIYTGTAFGASSSGSAPMRFLVWMGSYVFLHPFLIR